ncbi:MAG: hypothetical protein JWQ14_3327 [Adhaeribacter sp.]|nr:hypothetical protein [Adhaeribacter sp.]
MKKLMLAAALAAITWGTAQAQSLNLGIKGGFNYTNVSGNTGTYLDFDKAYKPGFNAGIFTNIGLFPMLAIQPEINYSTKGFRIEDERSSGGTNTQTDIKNRINYLDVPVLVQVKTGTIYFEAGPQVGFLLNQKTEQRRTITQTGLISEQTTKEPVIRDKSTSSYRTTDLGYAVGIGFQAPVSPVSLNFRYANSVPSYLKDSSTDARHSVFQISLSTWLPVAKR